MTEALHGVRFGGGWTKAMPGGAVQFDQTGLNTLSVPIMVQWRSKELVTVWPRILRKFPGVALALSTECCKPFAVVH